MSLKQPSMIFVALIQTYGLSTVSEELIVIPPTGGETGNRDEVAFSCGHGIAYRAGEMLFIHWV